MAEFLTTHGVAFQIENIIKNAKKQLVLISPYLKLSEILLERLKDAERNKVKIILVYGQVGLGSGEREKLKQLDSLSVYFCENLHAKCYFNEESMVITSMNLHEFSEKKNREMGILLSAQEDENVFKEALKEVESIIDSSTKDGLKGVGKTQRDYSREVKQNGYCIRCGTFIPCDLEKPFCRDCFLEWVEWENPDYKEYHCHTCGKRAPTSMAKPQCNSCYRKSV